MYRIKVTLFLVFLLISGCASSDIVKRNSGQQKDVMNVAVIEPLQNDKDNFWTILVAGEGRKPNERPMSRYLEAELLRTGKFNVIDREQLSSIIDEQKLSLSGLVEKEDFRKIGKLASLDGVIVLKQGLQTYSWVFPFIWMGTSASSKLINIDNGEIIWAVDSEFFGMSILPLVPSFINHEKKMAAAMVEKIKPAE